MSTLSRSTVNAFGLEPQDSRGVYETYYGGGVVDQYVMVQDASFGGIKGSKLPFFVMSSGRISSDEGGTISPDILSDFDLDFDFANAQFSVFSQEHCEGKVVYWTRDPYARVRVEVDKLHHIRVPFRLDGKEFTADLDTGAPDSVGSLDDIEDDFDLNQNSPDLKLLVSTDKRSHAYRYPFKVLSFGDVAVYNPSIRLIPDAESKTHHEFLIGMNILRHLHLYIAYKEEALYLTPATAH